MLVGLQVLTPPVPESRVRELALRGMEPRGMALLVLQSRVWEIATRELEAQARVRGQSPALQL